MTPRLLVRREAAKYLGHTLRSFERHVEPALRHLRIKHAGKSGGVYYDREDLDRWVEQQKGGASSRGAGSNMSASRGRRSVTNSPRESATRDWLLKKLGRSTVTSSPAAGDPSPPVTAPS